MAAASSFDSFWTVYPKKTAKQAALKAWNKLKPDEALVAEILRSLEIQKTSPQWTKEKGQFIPCPATWLNGRRWEDETGQQPQQRQHEKRDSSWNPFEEYCNDEAEMQPKPQKATNPYCGWRVLHRSNYLSH